MTTQEKLQRCIDEIDELKKQDMFSADFNNWQSRTRRILQKVFGDDSQEVKDFNNIHYIFSIIIGGGDDAEDRKYYDKGLDEARKLLLDLSDDIGHSPSSSEEIILAAYQGLQLHPEIKRAVDDLYRDGYYAESVEKAAKALTALVKLRSGVENLDGIKLMEHVFGVQKPILRFNALKDQSDLDEQKGFMLMFSGAIAGLRNPRAHKIVNDDPELALEFIAFVSLLAKLVDKSS